MSSFEPGQTVGRYRIIRPLGMGAMGRVYLAEDPRIERLLAIKTVRLEGREGDVEERKRRLLREAKAAGKLVHPHVVTLFDAGEDGDTLFLAFEYVKGADLSSRLEAGPPFTLAEALRVIRQAAEGLAYAHAQGIVHRDIKPSNLMLDERAWVKVSDFGIAKMAGQATELTMTGSVVGSPHYLSPEQIRGEELDGRSDLFSLGVVLYELLSRKRPFEGETLTSLIYQILHQEPPDVETAAGEVAGRLNAVVRKLMAKDRGDRYQTAGDLAADLSGIEKSLSSSVLAVPAATFLGQLPKAAAATTPLTAGLPSLPPPPPQPRPATQATVIQAPPKSNRTALILVAALVGLGVLGAGAYLLMRGLGGGESATQQTADTGSTETGTAAAEGAAVPSTTTVPGTSPNLSSTARDGRPSGPLEATGQRGSDRPAGVRVVSEAPAQTPADSRTVTSPADTPSLPQTSPAQTTPSRTVPSRTVEGPASTPPRDSRTVEPAADARIVPPAPAPEEPEPDDEPAAPAASPPSGRVVETGMTLLFPGKDKQLEGLYVIIDGRNVGQALDWKERGGYQLPEPGEHTVVLRKEGMREQRLRIDARPERASTPIGAALQAAAAAEGGGTPAIRVREGVVLKVEPRTARVLVGGMDRGQASEYGGGLRGWLPLGPGRHQISLRAPGHRSIDFWVVVESGAPEARRRLEYTLPKDGG